MNGLFGDMKTDEEKSNFFLSGCGYQTGVIAAAIQNDVAMAYHRCAEYKKELAALQAENERLRTAAPAVQVEPVGRVKTVGGYPDESEHTVQWLCKYKHLKDGDLLYTAPQSAEQQPAPDVAVLVEALERIANMSSMSYHSLESAKITARNALDVIADHRKQAKEAQS